jgi:hypothetical protein
MGACWEPLRGYVYITEIAIFYATVKSHFCDTVNAHLALPVHSRYSAAHIVYGSTLNPKGIDEASRVGAGCDHREVSAYGDL